MTDSFESITSRIRSIHDELKFHIKMGDQMQEENRVIIEGLSNTVRNMHEAYHLDKPVMQAFMETTKLHIEALTKDQAQRKAATDKLFAIMGELKDDMGKNRQANAVLGTKILALNGILMVIFAAVMRIFL